MKYKHIMLTLALIMCLVLPVAATGAYYESKYVTIDNTVKTDGCGELNAQTLTYHSLIGSQFTITRVDAANKTFVNGNRVDKIIADGYVKVAEPIPMELDHNGRYNDRVIPGVYLITLLDGNGGQPEYAIAEVVLSQKTSVVFLGHGVSMAEPSVCNPVFTIVNAMYGMVGNVCREDLVSSSYDELVYHEEVNHTIEHPAVPYSPAVYTQVPIKAVWSVWSFNIPPVDSVSKSRVSTTVDVAAHTEYSVSGHWEWWYGSKWYQNCWDHSTTWSDWSDTMYGHWNDIPSDHKQTRNVPATYKTEYKYITEPAHSHDGELITAEVLAKDARTEIVVDADAYTETIPHDAVYETVCGDEGSYVDVTEQLQTIVNTGQRTFVFDNRPSEGGIFDMVNGKLLSPVEDPAYGFVKTVTITYNKGCGSSDITIEANEYDLINLNTGIVEKQETS